MAWKVVFTPEAEAWMQRLSQADAERIGASIKLLEERGPALARPGADSIHSSRHHNMKELRSALGGRVEITAVFPDERVPLLSVPPSKQ